MRPILTIHENLVHAGAEAFAQLVAEKMNFDIQRVENAQLSNIDTIVTEADAALIVIGIEEKKSIQFYLNLFRQTRVPYIFVPHDWHGSINAIALPVTRFEEDREKAPYTASIAKYFDLSVTIIKPNDYGSMAQRNIDAITSLFDSRQTKYLINQATRDSAKVELEATLSSTPNTLVVVGASRDYGLDDIIFGPKERHILRRSKSPVMLINPRGDLYALCD